MDKLTRRALFKALFVAPFIPRNVGRLAPALAFHPRAFELAMAELPAADISRCDVLYGFAHLRPEFAVVGQIVNVPLPSRYLKAFR